ncbi:hypothetical protein MVLG_05257 [Microbotryum lychnidis-dioicae p1A1 Lamole]|uniref:Uncharacterized protein n=1 Tax=Microbotryum lychnidis-dioicae (strain p1A1 Lamole / MvSl-1064) TaxID=683840 RepID=U5HDP6_USTV1|nr:hypothetical protein MVLG_05257 [Microbotryum lychnidis-dioicae p1A1 Lamole]|eukprot:KDE04299.1 hypothetical protein MVLG_05257 [Microbotryum lychnidis-dioicae p1A1 Lamole]
MLSSIPKISFTRTLYQATRSSPLSRSLRTSSSLMSSSHHEPGPIEASIHEKLTTSLSPSHLSISNDSASHSHHSAMRSIGGGSGETHFTVEIVSERFEGLVSTEKRVLLSSGRPKAARQLFRSFELFNDIASSTIRSRSCSKSRGCTRWRSRRKVRTRSLGNREWTGAILWRRYWSVATTTQRCLDI